MKQEAKYRQLRKLGQELHIPMFEAFLMVEVFDKDGKLIHKHHQRSHSWVRHAYNMLMSTLGGINADDDTWGAGYINSKRLNGTLVYSSHAFSLRGDLSVEASGKGYMGSASDDDQGIVVGSGTNAESFEDYALQTLIAHGTGSGELSYPDGEAPTTAYVAGTKVYTATHIRYFNNNSGGGININEVGLVIEARVGGSVGDRLMSRDHLASTVTIPDTGQLKVTYTISLTYPS